MLSSKSNVVLDGVLTKNKKDGMERPVVHKEVTTEFDQERLGNYLADVLTTDDTYKLRSFCWYAIALHFGLRGGEVFAQLKVSNLVFKKDEEGKDFVQLHSDFCTKNTAGGTKSKESHSRRYASCGFEENYSVFESWSAATFSAFYPWM